MIADNDSMISDSLIHGGGCGGGHAVALTLAHVHIVLAGPHQLLPLSVLLLDRNTTLHLIQHTFCDLPSQDESQTRESHMSFHTPLSQTLPARRT